MVVYVGKTGSRGPSGADSKIVSSIADIQCAEGITKIIFSGGRQFEGSLIIENARNLHIASDGDLPAVIYAGEGSGIILRNCEKVTVSGLRLEGIGWRQNNHGRGLQVVGGSDISICNIEACGFRHAGISFGGTTNLTIEGCFVHDNGYSGITSDEGGLSRNVSIRHCKAYDSAGDPDIMDNHSGSGIVLYETHGALVEYCEAAGNGWAQRQTHGNGPVGIWCACDCKQVVFRWCISRYNRTQPGAVDGDGFDFDGFSADCLMEYDYSYGNEGSGYLLCEYGSGGAWHNNHVRYCVSVGDANRVKSHGSLVFYTPGRQEFKDSSVKNSLIVTTAGSFSIADRYLHPENSGLEVTNNIMVPGSDPLRETGNPALKVYDNRVISAPGQQQLLLDGAPALSDPRKLQRMPVYRMLEKDMDACENAVVNNDLAALFGGFEFNWDIKSKPEYVLDYSGRDLEGGMKKGYAELYYDSIKPGVSTKIRGKGEVSSTLPCIGSKRYCLKSKTRLQSPLVEAFLFVDAGDKRQKQPINGTVGDYIATELYFDGNPSSIFQAGISVENDLGSVFVDVIEVYETGGDRAPVGNALSGWRSFGDVYEKDGCIYLNQPGSRIIRQTSNGNEAYVNCNEPGTSPVTVILPKA